MPAAVKPPRTLYDKIWDDHVVYVTLLPSLFAGESNSGL